jgi:hypothetical protein
MHRRALQFVQVRSPFQWTRCERVLLGGKNSVAIARLRPFTSVAIAEKSVTPSGHEILLSHF